MFIYRILRYAISNQFTFKRKRVNKIPVAEAFVEGFEMLEVLGLAVINPHFCLFSKYTHRYFLVTATNYLQ